MLTTYYILLQWQCEQSSPKCVFFLKISNVVEGPTFENFISHEFRFNFLTRSHMVLVVTIWDLIFNPLFTIKSPSFLKVFGNGISCSEVYFPTIQNYYYFFICVHSTPELMLVWRKFYPIFTWVMKEFTRLVANCDFKSLTCSMNSTWKEC